MLSPNHPNSGWTEERVDTLKALWFKGLSVSQIAAHLGGCSRNAVIGKVHRMGIAERGSAMAPQAILARRAAKVAKTKAPKVRARVNKPPTPKAEARPPKLKAPRRGFEGVAVDNAPEPLPLAERKSFMCCYPVRGFGADTLYCCAITEETGDRQYCPAHRKLMWQPKAVKPVASHWDEAPHRRRRAA